MLTIAGGVVLGGGILWLIVAWAAVTVLILSHNKGLGIAALLLGGMLLIGLLGILFA
jgi:hypothetical protein